MHWPLRGKRGKGSKGTKTSQCAQSLETHHSMGRSRPSDDQQRIKLIVLLQYSEKATRTPRKEGMNARGHKVSSSFIGNGREVAGEMPT